MSNNEPTENLMERLERVDSKLEKLLAIQTLKEEDGMPKILNLTEEEFSEDPLRPHPDNNDSQKTCGSSAPAKKALPTRVTISAKEVDTIFQKVEKINHDAEILDRVEKLERQNRKIVTLGSMFMTLVILMLGASTFLMVQANLLNKGVFLNAWQMFDPPKPSSGEATGKANDPPTPKPIAGVHDPIAIKPIVKVSDPKPVAAPTNPKPAEATAPVKYVGFMSSNKYHYPGCKWAAGINHYTHRTFSSVKEAREKGYIPCSTCRPPDSDQ